MRLKRDIDVFGDALLDYWDNGYSEDITTVSSLEEDDVIPLPYLFRSFKEMPKIEQTALELAKGKVLDVGCGAGSHGLYLQEKGLEVTALDVSAGALQVCGKRGLKSLVNSSILDFSGTQFDTLLLLMNGIGLAGNLENLGSFLEHLKSLLNPSGQILLDSGDIIYMYEQDNDGGVWVPGEKKYYGEVTFRITYKKQKSEPFNWLYLDFNTLNEHCERQNINCELVISGAHYDYLARLVPKRE
ncbi:MAG: class I SAM-dependent methyltransferase [Bacteroidota bacterium]